VQLISFSLGPSRSRMFRKLYLLFYVGLLLAGCNYNTLLQKIVPKGDDAFARRFLNAVRTGDYTAAEQMLVPSLRNAKSESGLRAINRVLARGEPVSVEVIGCNLFTNASSQGTTRTTNLSYQIRFPDAWAAGNVAVGHQGDATAIVDTHFQSIPNSLEILNRFTFAGKSAVHYLVLAVCIAVPLLILATLIICIRSRIRRKWLWIIFILLGFMQFQFDWASGHFSVQPISFLLFGASAFRSSPYAPWVLGFAVPIGAIIFLLFRRRLLLDDATPQA
jgi:hypothetical protein